jgi:hypothetical protein
MSHLLEKNRQVIERLKAWCQSLPEDAKRYLPPSVTPAILQYESGSESESIQALEICRVFLNEDGSINRGSFPSSEVELEAFLESQLLSGAYELNCVGLLTGDSAQANFNAVAGHQNPRLLVVALAMLNRVGLLTGDLAQANRDAVARHQEPFLVAEVLGVLNRAGLLTGAAAQPNFNAFERQRDPRAVASTLGFLSYAGLLTGDAAQANFNTLILYSDILFHNVTPGLWSRIPSHLFTPARFTALMEICREHTDNPAAGRALVIAYINREILGINEPAAAEIPRINAGQSTHTASVHQTVSESATRLMLSYGSEISDDNLDEKIKELSTWLNAQPDLSLKVRKAKSCLQRLTAPDYSFTDPSSQVSMKQLLALFWLAIHDDTRLIGTLDDAKLRLIEGLYEIQREYNFSENGEDNGAGRDIPCCAAGAFNKMIEKGQGVHPDMVINFISIAGFSLKLPLVVREEAMAYLKSRASSNLGLLLKAIEAEDNANSVGPIWAEIQDLVATRMFEEFGSLFGHDRTRPGFWTAIGAGEYCDLNPGNLSELSQLIGKVSRDGGAVTAGAAPDGFFAATPSPKDMIDDVDDTHRP